MSVPVSPHHRPRNSRTESTGIGSLGVTQLRSSKAGNQSQASPTQGAPLFIIYSAAPHPREGGEVLNASHGVILAFLCFWVKIVVRPGVRSIIFLPSLTYFFFFGMPPYSLIQKPIPETKDLNTVFFIAAVSSMLKSPGFIQTMLKSFCFPGKQTKEICSQCPEGSLIKVPALSIVYITKEKNTT